MTTDEINARLAKMTLTELRDLLRVVTMAIGALTAAEKAGFIGTASITLSVAGAA